MAPFKLKLRMGNSRSTSEEIDIDTQASQALLNSSIIGFGASDSTIDSADCNSLTSLNNDKRSLIPNIPSSDRIGFINPNNNQAHRDSNSNTPPPDYEQIFKEEQIGNLRISDLEKDKKNDTPTRSLNEKLISLSENSCTNPNCGIKNVTLEQDIIQKKNNFSKYFSPTMTTDAINESIGSSDPLLAPSENTSDNYDIKNNKKVVEENNRHRQQLQKHQEQQQQQQNETESNTQGNLCQSNKNDKNDDEDDYSNRYYIQPEVTSEVISNKSSKRIYKAVAKQWGITCKMSEQCRCMECQSNYFDCEFDRNEQQKTDGGLGAGAPMFISEVMHGTACNIL